MDQELLTYLENRFREASQQMESFRQETTQKIATLEDKVHLNHIALEGLRDDVRQVAEGVAGVSERLDTFRGEMAHELKGVHRRLSILEAHAESKGRESLKTIREREDNRPL